MQVMRTDPSPPIPPRPLPAHIAAAASVAAIFYLDTLTPVGVAIPVLYTIPTLLLVWSGCFREPLVVAALATVLTAAGFYASPPGGSVDVAIANRLLAVVVIWITAALVAGYLRLVERWSAGMSASQSELQTSLRRLEDIRYALDQASIVAATDQRGIINYVNDKFCEISKYSREELIGQDHRIINSGYHPKEFIRTLWRTIAQGEVWRGELRNRAKDGSIYWVDTTIVPFLNEQGKPWQYLSIRSDITQRKAAEEQLRDQAALTQLGRLAAVVAHEVRNPLAGLKGSLQVLERRMPQDMAGREIIPPMIERIDALNRTVQDILRYSKPTPPKTTRFELQPVIEDASRAARAAVACPEIRVSGERAIVSADREMCHAILLNLLLNACQASGGLAVDVSVTTQSGRCELRIMDRGPGISADIREQIFEPFITTKPGGTGLGLAIARRLTLLQGGTIALEDREAGGTTAILTFPLA
jgi:PAS domain S-box-containing protein